MSTEDASRKLDAWTRLLPAGTPPTLILCALAAAPWLSRMYDTTTEARNALLSVSTNMPVILREFRATSDHIEKIGERLDKHIEQTDRFHREVDGRIRKIEDKVGDLYTEPRFETAKPRS